MARSMVTRSLTVPSLEPEDVEDLRATDMGEGRRPSVPWRSDARPSAAAPPRAASPAVSGGCAGTAWGGSESLEAPTRVLGSEGSGSVRKKHSAGGSLPPRTPASITGLEPWPPRSAETDSGGVSSACSQAPGAPRCSGSGSRAFAAGYPCSSSSKRGFGPSARPSLSPAAAASAPPAVATAGEGSGAGLASGAAAAAGAGGFSPLRSGELDVLEDTEPWLPGLGRAAKSACMTSSTGESLGAAQAS
mmetsp:Transcript_23670/g.73743  ORF Transcript_23670/g.73743 Transcript_23670/m.73743 type:complete len:247 (-) Transcript_23670:49-789(-)